MTKIHNKNLTDSLFWENFWKSTKLPCTIDYEFSFDRCLSKTLLHRIGEVYKVEDCPQPEKRISILEVGAAPGKWLSIFSQDFFTVSGIEYSKAGMIALQKNLEMLLIQPKDLIFGDFFAIEPQPIHDIVMSLGFIEHFDDPIMVVERHLKWLRPNGLLIIGVPNFTGVHGFFQKYLDVDILNAHNVSIMNKEWFENIQEKLKIQKHSLDFIGSFEPSLPLTYRNTPLRNFPIKTFLRIASHIRRWKYLDNFNSPLISSYILGVYKKQ